MYYAIIAEDNPDSLHRRRQARQAHLERIQELVDAGRILVAGPHPAIDGPDPGSAGFIGSLIIAEFDSLEEATRWANADPYVDAGIFCRVDVRPFVPVLP